MNNIHENYNQLTPSEKNFVDEAFKAIFTMRDGFEMEGKGVPLSGDDSAERAVDAVAKWVIESRAQ